MEIEMTAVQSTLIRAIGHDPETRTLRVQFQDGALWQYAEVDSEKFDRLRNADSVGRFFHTEIKSQHSGSRVPVDVPDDTQ